MDIGALYVKIYLKKLNNMLNLIMEKYWIPYTNQICNFSVKKCTLGLFLKRIISNQNGVHNVEKTIKKNLSNILKMKKLKNKKNMKKNKKSFIMMQEKKLRMRIILTTLIWEKIVMILNLHNSHRK